MRSAAFIVAGLLSTLGAGCEDSAELLIIGHRGSPYEALENSMAGFELAYQHGADGVELDVQVTKDGRAVVMHDETLDRTTVCAGAVADRTVAQLAACELQNGEPILTLEEALGDLAEWFEILFLEIKTPEDRPLAPEVISAFTDEVAEVVLASGRAERVVIISYDKAVLQRLAARQAEGILVGWDDSEGESVSKARRFNMPWALMPVRSVDPRLGVVAAGLGQKLAVYQVNSPAQFLEAEAAGVQAMMADSIYTICALLGRRPRDLPARPKKK